MRITTTIDRQLSANLKIIFLTRHPPFDREDQFFPSVLVTHAYFITEPAWEVPCVVMTNPYFVDLTNRANGNL